MWFVVITLPAVSAEQRGPSDACALDVGVRLSFHVVFRRISPNLTFGAVQGETRGRLMMVSLSRIAHGNVSVHFHHGLPVDDVDAAVKLIFQKRRI